MNKFQIEQNPFFFLLFHTLYTRTFTVNTNVCILVKYRLNGTLLSVNQSRSPDNPTDNVTPILDL